MRLSVIVLSCLISVNALAQSNDTIRKDTSKRFIVVDARSINKHDKPLYIVDGIIYKGNIRKINPHDILRIDVLKSPGATNIYGKQGENGVILITTKPRQNIHTIKKGDTIVSKLPDSAVYVIDGEISNKKLVGVEAKDILSIDIIKQDVASAHFEGEARNGLVVVVTKNRAIKSYQEKLSAFSTEYKEYVARQMSSSNNDNGILYIILKNGEPVLLKEEDKIRKLYNLPAESISKVELNKKETCCGTNVSVIITTK